MLKTVKFAMEIIIFEPFYMKPCPSDHETRRNSHGGGGWGRGGGCLKGFDSLHHHETNRKSCGSRGGRC